MASMTNIFEVSCECQLSFYHVFAVDINTLVVETVKAKSRVRMLKRVIPT